jgi:hypothetical protein
MSKMKKKDPGKIVPPMTKQGFSSTPSPIVGTESPSNPWILHINKWVKLFRKCLTLLCSRKIVTVEMKALKGDNDFAGL